MNKLEIITIDGPSGVGKSTLSKAVAVELGFVYMDTGAMYRAVGYHLQQHDVELTDETAMRRCLNDIEIQLYPSRSPQEDVQVKLNGQDISDEIRTTEMAMIASRTSAIPVVREKLTEMQRKFGEKGGIVAEGRDTGTVVFPQATYKFFLEATPETRTRRRALQLRKKGESVDEKRLFSMIVERDKNDREREIAPLKKADDAILIDTSELNIAQVKEIMLGEIKKLKEIRARSNV